MPVLKHHTTKWLKLRTVLREIIRLMTTLPYTRILPHSPMWYVICHNVVFGDGVGVCVCVFQSEVYSTGSIFDSAGTYVPTLVRLLFTDGSVFSLH